MRLLGNNANCAESLGVISNSLARLLAEAAERLKIGNYGPARTGPWFNGSRQFLVSRLTLVARFPSIRLACLSVPDT